MHECIDIYTRLLIATITFVVPILINLLSSFSAGEKRRKELASSSEEEVNKRVRETFQNDPSNLKETVKGTAKAYDYIDNTTKVELNKLNPIIQFWAIFFPLAFSFVCINLYYLIKANKWSLGEYISPFIPLVIGGLSYLIALFFIIRILYTVVHTKRIIDNS